MENIKNLCKNVGEVVGVVVGVNVGALAGIVGAGLSVIGLVDETPGKTFEKVMDTCARTGAEIGTDLGGLAPEIAAGVAVKVVAYQVNDAISSRREQPKQITGNVTNIKKIA